MSHLRRVLVIPQRGASQFLDRVQQRQFHAAGTVSSSSVGKRSFLPLLGVPGRRHLYHNQSGNARRVGVDHAFITTAATSAGKMDDNESNDETSVHASNEKRGRIHEPLILREHLILHRALMKATIQHVLSDQRRYLSSKDDPSSSKADTVPSKPPPTNNEETSTTTKTTAPTDAAAPAAAAKPKAPLSPFDDTTTTTATMLEPPWSTVIRVPKYGQDAEKAVQSLQKARKERARVKTAANVRRALYGNMAICVAKLAAWISSGSSSMMSEFVHSVVDCGNQSLLLMGLRDSRNVPDKRHPYGYGKSVYFWALVSALGTFFLGAGLSMSHAIQELVNPSLTVISNEVWAVLGMSFAVDGYVLYRTVSEIEAERPKDVSFLAYTAKIRDPATLAVLLEDGAACLGILIAIAGISASHATGNPVFDGMAGVGISCLLGGIGMALVRVNHRFLIGQSVGRDMLDEIEHIIKSRRSIDHVSKIQSQWTAPETFSFKAEVDFDGTYLAAHLLPRYQSEFEKAKGNLDQELEVLLSWYAEDVIRAVEREVRHIESMIRQKYPGAEYIELEPMSKHADQFAIDDSFEEKLLLIEKETIQRFIRVVHQRGKERESKSEATQTGPESTDSKSKST